MNKAVFTLIIVTRWIEVIDKFFKNHVIQKLTLCVSWKALIRSCTNKWIAPASLSGAWFAGHNARFLIKPITALTNGQRDGGFSSFTMTWKKIQTMIKLVLVIKDEDVTVKISSKSFNSFRSLQQIETAYFCLRFGLLFQLFWNNKKQ